MKEEARSATEYEDGDGDVRGWGRGEGVNQLQRRGGAGMDKGNEKGVCIFSLAHS